MYYNESFLLYHQSVNYIIKNGVNFEDIIKERTSIVFNEIETLFNSLSIKWYYAWMKNICLHKSDEIEYQKYLEYFNPFNEDSELSIPNSFWIGFTKKGQNEKV